MKIKSLAAASLTAACLIANSFELNASAYPGHSELLVPKTGRAVTSRNIFFPGYCVSLSIQIDNNSVVYGTNNGCNSPDVVSGSVTTFNGVPNTIVVSGYFGYLLGFDSALLAKPLIIAIFPNGTFKAYSGSVSAVDLLATGNWSSTRSRTSGPKLRKFAAP